jgi:hypothetical protein
MHTIILGLKDAFGREITAEVSFIVDDQEPSAELLTKYISYGSTVAVAFDDDLAGVDPTSVVLTMRRYKQGGWSGGYSHVNLRYNALNLFEEDGVLIATYMLPIDGLDSILLESHAGHGFGEEPLDGHIIILDDEEDDSHYNQLAVYVSAADNVGNEMESFGGSSSCEGGVFFAGMMILDIIPPTIAKVEPVGMPFDNDDDGIANEDGFDRFDDDNDGLYDEDPEDFRYEVLDADGVEVNINVDWGLLGSLFDLIPLVDGSQPVGDDPLTDALVKGDLSLELTLDLAKQLNVDLSRIILRWRSRLSRSTMTMTVDTTRTVPTPSTMMETAASMRIRSTT